MKRMQLVPVETPSGRLGRVVSMAGAHVVVLLDDAGPFPAESVQIGNLVKMRTRASTVFAIVSGMSIPMPARSEGDREYKVVEAEIIGEVNGLTGDQFRRGASMTPALGDVVMVATPEDLRQVYARPNRQTIRVGTIHQDPSVPAHIIVDDLLGRHFAIVGTTGSGKSCTVGLVINGIISSLPSARVVIIDPHGEYPSAFGDKAEVIDPCDLQLPYWLLTFEELVEVVFGMDSRDMAAEISILRELLAVAKQRIAREEGHVELITVDTPVPYKMGDLLRLIDDETGRLDRRHDLTPYLRLKGRLNTLLSDRRFAFMFPSNVVVRDNMRRLLSQIFRIPVEGKPVGIVNLVAVPSEVLNVVVSVLCRMTFDIAHWSDKALPILLVCEEAHRYAPQNTSSNIEPARRALSRIAREGRKYGVSLCVVTQRPSELASGILSQCNTILALRLTNEHDQEFLRGAVSEASAGLLDPLPSLGNAEVIAVGEGVSVPMRIILDPVPENQRPASKPASFSKIWSSDDVSLDYLGDVINRWRRQGR